MPVSKLDRVVGALQQDIRALREQANHMRFVVSCSRSAGGVSSRRDANRWQKGGCKSSLDSLYVPHTPTTQGCFTLVST